MQMSLPRLGVWYGVSVMVGVLSALVLAEPVRSGLPAVQNEQERKLAPVKGELRLVDTETMTLEVRTPDGMDVRFRYTEDTEVTGAKKDIAGLATEKGVRVTVHYEVDEQPPEEAPAYVAVRIDVHGPGR